MAIEIKKRVLTCEIRGGKTFWDWGLNFLEYELLGLQTHSTFVWLFITCFWSDHLIWIVSLVWFGEGK